MPPSSPVDGRSYSQKSTVVRQAAVTPLCCFLILPVKQHKKCHMLDPKEKSQQTDLSYLLQDTRGERWSKTESKVPPACVPVEKLKCTILSGEANQRKRDRERHK